MASVRSEQQTVAALSDVPGQPARWRQIARRIVRNRMVLVGLVIIAVVLITALAAPLVATHDPLTQNIRARLAAPSASHYFGTDQLGRDVFSRVVHGARTALTTALWTVVLSGTAGTVLGLISGYFGNRVDNVIMRAMDILMAFPDVLLAIGIMAMLGPSGWNIVIALSLVYTPRFARIVRGQVLSVKQQEFVESARALGASTTRIIREHILPNCFAPLMIQATVTIVYAIRTEATLSFLGLGTPPPNPSWGNILGDGRGFMRQAPWISVFPGLAIVFAILGFNMLGDGLRDILDPRLTGKTRK